MTSTAEPDLEVHGEFWLPGTDDKKVPGILTFSAEEGGSLKLIGSFTEVNLLFEEAPARDYSRILGRDDKAGYTLDGCLRTRETQTLGRGARQNFYVGQVVKDVWFDKDEAIEAEMVDVEIDHLLAWTKISGITNQWTTEDELGGKGRLGPPKSWPAGKGTSWPTAGTSPPASSRRSRQRTAEVHDNAMKAVVVRLRHEAVS
ncbi:hypothetical protein IOD16_30980 [Saccharothrix sp. 6-C]|uniref:ApeA N-terminal domain 1-containing protein n=1 Tax=Saccharothrix sp. 6-C TaxID=2781735 RepID=UPI00191750BC|nr:hypothetical protein [Saccharothrix sp. 6-C]QQQ75478.1 hypothetical protein IOD16_30980 [Saccharothrix sp. 6-C]